MYKLLVSNEKKNYYKNNLKAAQKMLLVIAKVCLVRDKYSITCS